MEAESTPQAVRVTLEGAYRPSGYFEEPISLERAGYTLAVSEGWAVVTMRRLDPLPTAEERADIACDVEWLFRIRLVTTGRPYDFDGLTMKRHYANGNRDIWAAAETGFFTYHGETVDFILKDKDGTILRDTKAERLAQDRSFLDRCVRHANDSLLRKLISSFGRALEENENMMVYLYEIRDAISNHYGEDKIAKKTLGLSNSQWSDFGRIANKEPIQESRHRGSHAVLRPATEEERSRVITTAKTMIEKYLETLDAGKGA